MSDFTIPGFMPFIAFLAVLAVIPPLRRLAVALDFTDKPGGRKTHEGSVPLIGGLIIFPIFMAGSFLAGVDWSAYWPLFAALALVLITGAFDDRAHIRPWIKFTVQFVAAFLIVLPGGAQVHELGYLFGFGEIGLGVMSVPFSVFCVVLLINAINLMDGLDGLAAGKSFVVLLWLMLACALAGEWPPFWTMAVLMGALAGFLFYNMRHPFRDKASIFLGDAGSMSLGLVLAWYVIGLTQEPDPVLVPISVAWIVALPVIDACGQFFRRIKDGRHPFSPDRGHFHHHFVHAGIPIGHSTALILLIGFILGGIGYGGVLIGIPVPVLTFGWIALLAAHMVLSLKPEGFIRLLSRFGK